jgi:hypothetical protein
MTQEKPKEFGKRGPPPVVVHKPKPPGAVSVSGQKRSLAVSLAIMGALSLGVYETFQWVDRKLNCEPDPAKPEELICKHRSGSTYRRSSGSHWSSGSSGGGSHWFGSSSSSSTHGVSFGGFGHSGGSFGGG